MQNRLRDAMYVGNASNRCISVIRALDLLVIDQFCDGWMIATDCTFMICLWKLDRVEFHL